MDIYSFLAMPIGLVVGIVLIISKKRNGVVLKKLDYASVAINIILTFVYFWAAAFTAFLTAATRPEGDGFGAVLGWMLVFIMFIAPIVSGVSLGFSVRLRRSGKSLFGFLIQFVGILWTLLASLIYITGVNAGFLNGSIN